MVEFTASPGRCCGSICFLSIFDIDYRLVLRCLQPFVITLLGIRRQFLFFQRKAFCDGKLLCAAANEHYVRRFFHYSSCYRNWMLDAFKKSNTSAIKGLVHYGRIQCNETIAIWIGTKANTTVY